VSLLKVGTWTLRRRVLAICVLAALVLSGLVVSAAITAANSNRQLDDVINRTSPMRAAGERLSTSLVDQETGIRGYAISGKETNLRPYEQGRRSEAEQIARIKSLLRPGDLDDKVRADLTRVEQLVTTWHTDVADPILNAIRTQGPDAGREMVIAADTTQFDEVRDSIESMQEDISVLRASSAAQAKAASQRMIAIQVATAAIVLVTGIALILLLDRLVTRPVTDLARQVRAVAEGDYDRHLDSHGSPELRSLAEDVDGMRRKIASELSEVREAREQIEWVNEQLKVQADELTRSNRDLEQFAYVASHDLQEPLRKVASFCQLLQRRYQGKLDERADQYIAFAVDGAQRMQRLINDLLAFSRIGRLTSGFTDVDLNRVLTEVTSQLEARAGDDAEIVFSDLPTVEGEEPLLTTLFVNLVGNSLKFRRPDVAPRIEVTAGRDGDEWLINVRDNGIGIEAEFADKVFVIFQRLHARDAYEGTGIGLAIVKKIVEYHGGRIWLDLEATDGASIWFTLPVLAGIPVQERLKEVTTS
jgi:signal transduction histidine kinase